MALNLRLEHSCGKLITRVPIEYGGKMRRMLASAAFAVGLFLAGCSSSSELDPLVGEWMADGAQPARYSDFGDDAMIRVDKAGKAVLGTSPTSLCGAATATVNEAASDQTNYRIAFPTRTWCVTVDVPPSLDVVVDGDTLEASLTGSQTEVTYRFTRAGTLDTPP
jgi:hypothetical protein